MVMTNTQSVREHDTSAHTHGSNDPVVGLPKAEAIQQGRPAVYKRGVFTNTCLFVCWRHAWLWGLFMNTLFVNTFMFTFVYLSHLVNTSLWQDQLTQAAQTFGTFPEGIAVTRLHCHQVDTG